MQKPIYIIVPRSNVATVSEFSVDGSIISVTNNSSFPNKVTYNVNDKRYVFLTLETLKSYLAAQAQQEAKKILTPHAFEMQELANNQNSKTMNEQPLVKSQDLGIITAKTPNGGMEAVRVETDNGTGVTSTYEITIDTRESAAANTFLLGDGMGLIAAYKNLPATDAIITGTFDGLAIATLKNFAALSPMATRAYQFTTNDATGAIYQTPFLRYGQIDAQNVYIERPINVQRGRNGSELDKSVRWMPQLNFTAGQRNALVLVIPAGILFTISFDIHSVAVGSIQGMFMSK